ncbi:ABC-2 type transport system permease protein [Amycolatopsis arida]|uniref:Transport permease protein n=1 Tax=Amycolatopsis arida TaxID=587909 RepID=A0A1I5SI85_9PSEU|nr:ABC transporter permease [Amycolatopsis arida]TDX96469.1 ABC-2 type transport system permease protein [Amycolatopsis arida]SFP70480.1 ABC-2 type transport system permease protein [Amycolatopsis arida]
MNDNHGAPLTAADRARVSRETSGGVTDTLARAVPTQDLVDRNRPPAPGPLSTSLSFTWRQLLGFKHAPEQLVDVLFMPVLTLLMFNYLFGTAISGSTGDYLQFVLPGVLVQMIVLMSVYTGTSLNNDLTKGIYDRFRTLPIWQPANIVGNLVADVSRFVITVTATVLLGLLLGFRPAGGLPGVVLAALVLLAFAFGVGWVFAALGMLVRKPESVSTTSMAVVFPLTFLSNIFVPAETLPSWLRAFVAVNPISHAATAMRGLMHGTATVGQVGLVLGGSAVLVAVFGSLTMYLYRNRE